MFNERKVFSNGYSAIFAEEKNLTPGGAPKCYHVVKDGSKVVSTDILAIEFQSQSPEEGVNGVTNEDLLWIMIDRLKCFQKGPHPCKENEEIIGLLKAALVICNSRAARIREGR